VVAADGRTDLSTFLLTPVGLAFLLIVAEMPRNDVSKTRAMG
jgi:hypothetical protein